MFSSSPEEVLVLGGGPKKLTSMTGFWGGGAQNSESHISHAQNFQTVIGPVSTPSHSIRGAVWESAPSVFTERAIAKGDELLFPKGVPPAPSSLGEVIRESVNGPPPPDEKGGVDGTLRERIPATQFITPVYSEIRKSDPPRHEGRNICRWVILLLFLCGVFLPVKGEIDVLVAKIVPPRGWGHALGRDTIFGEIYNASSLFYSHPKKCPTLGVGRGQSPLLNTPMILINILGLRPTPLRPDYGQQYWYQGCPSTPRFPSPPGGVQHGSESETSLTSQHRSTFAGSPVQLVQPEA